MPDTPDLNKWRFSKDIPVSVLGFIIVQTVLLTWFLAGQNSALNTVITAQAKSQASSYTKEDAAREREFQDQKQLNATSKQDEILRRITILEQAQALQLQLRK